MDFAIMRKELENSYQGLLSFFLLCIPVVFCLGTTIPLPMATNGNKLFALHVVLCLLSAMCLPSGFSLSVTL